MTTIAYKDGVMASDSVQTLSSIRIGRMQKIARRSDGTLVGAAGNASYIKKLLKWADSKSRAAPPLPVEEDDSVGLVVHKGKVTLLEPLGSAESFSDYVAIGSGGEIAMGAMAFGATAAEAVGIAIQHDCYSGGEVAVLMCK